MTDTIQDRLRKGVQYERYGDMEDDIFSAEELMSVAAAHIDAQDAKIKALVEACDELKADMLERSRAKMDVIYGEEYKIVNAGNGAWRGFCAALASVKETT